MYPVLRTETFAKLFFLISCTGLFFYATLAFYTFHTAYTSIGQMQTYQDPMKDIPHLERDYDKDLGFDKDLKYILFWSEKDKPPKSFPEGQQIFTEHRCEYANCFLTSDKNMLKDGYSNFDAIVFNITIVKNWKKSNLPVSRSQKQKYVFYSLESSKDTPICNIHVDNYFNWTWTYKLDSDIVSPFIEVTDFQGNVVAPKPNVNWTTNLSVLGNGETGATQPKQRAMIWNVESCDNSNNKDVFIRELEAEFRMNFLDFDVFGCGRPKCSRGECLNKNEKNYYFYLAYEDSFAEDYVTKKVTKAYNDEAVPIVLGGADYRKFLPDGSYIKAEPKSADQLAAKVHYIIRNPSVYYTYFRWKNSYSIHETEEMKGICELCAYLNDESKFGSFSVYKDFRKWWYSGPLYDRCIPKGAEDLADVISYINSSIHLI